MGVIGHWRRSALGAGGVALLLPLGLALGVALTTALGGGNGLHALAQVFSGPSLPGAGGRPQAPGLESARDVPPIPLPPRHPAATGGQGSGASGRSTPTRPGTTTRPHTTPQHTGGGSHPSRPTPSSGGQSSPPASNPAPAPQPQHSALHNTGQQVADTTKNLPAPVGPVAGGAAQTVVDLIP